MSKIEKYNVDDYLLKINPGGTITLDTDNSGTIEILGNLTVYGQTTTVNTTDLDIQDNIIVLNKGETGAGVTLLVSGVAIDRGGLPNAQLYFDERINWLDSQTFSQSSGAFSFTKANGDMVGIVTNSISTLNNADLVLLGNGTGTVTVTGTTDYERQLFPYTGDNITFNGVNRDNLETPIDSDALVNVQSMMDYVYSYQLYNWQDRIVSPITDGDTSVRLYSVDAGDPVNKMEVNLNGFNILNVETTQTTFKNNLSTTLSILDLFNNTATTVNAFGEATSINIGSGSGTTLVNNELSVVGNMQVLPGSAIVNTVFDSGVVQNSTILLKNTNLQGFIPTPFDLELAELYVNTTDGKIYFERYKNAVTTIREIGLADRVADVYYVSDVSGDDSNDGTTLSEPFKTIDAALQTIANIRATQNQSEFQTITVYVKAGRYSLNNPVRVPARVAVLGDNLRTVTVRPKNLTQDLFWVNNGCMIANMTFKNHLHPAAIVAFATDGSAGFITQSPYVQNCTSITTTGTGMRIDGNHAKGLRSMVCDAFTQYNQGGIGIHLLNRGNAQLVSIFTICCEVAFLCEKGGFCSLSNSNTTFGNYGLKADGVSPAMYSGRVSSQPQTNQFIIDRLVAKPNIGDAVKFYGDTNYYTVRGVGPLNIHTDVIETQYFDEEPIEYVDDREYILSQVPFLRTEAIQFIEKEFPFFQYNEELCSRDIGLIVEAIADDMVFGSNYRTVVAARSYLRAASANVISGELNETVATINKVRDLVLEMVDMGTTQYNRVLNNFNLITTVMQNGAGSIPAITYPTPVGVDANRKKAADLLQLNRQYLIEEGIAYINTNLNLISSYNSELCARDIGYIVDALRYDMMFGSNFRSITAGRSYYRAGASHVTGSQKRATISVLEYLKSIVVGFVSGNTVAEASVTNNMNMIIDILDNGLGVVPGYVIPNPTGYNAGLQIARNAIETNRESLKTQVTNHISATYPSLSYDVNKCKRDIGYVLDAVYYDLTYGGNLESLVAGNAYYSGTTLQIPSNEKTASIDAYNYLKSLIATLTAGNNPASSIAQSLIDNIVTILDTQTQPTVVTPDITWVSTALKDRNTILINATPDIKTGIISHIEGTFEYDTELCERDIGLVINAVSYDMIFGSNFRSITAGRSYYRAGAAVVTSTQKVATVATFAYLRSILLGIVSGNSTAEAAVTDNMNIIIGILRDGLSSVPSYVRPDPTFYDSGFQHSRNLINANSNFIKAEVIEYLNKAYPSLVYDHTKCQRDVGYILDAVYYDMTYGGNLETIVAANAYYSKSALQIASTEKLATLSAYNFMQTLIGKIALNESVTALQGSVTQVTGTAGSTDASDYAKSLMDIIKVTIDTSTPQTEVIPNLTWVDSGLLTLYYAMIASTLSSASSITSFLAGNYLYSESMCRRDIGYVVDAVTYDMLYQGNTQSDVSGRAYFSAGVMQIPDADVQSSLDTFSYVKDVAKLVVTNSVVTSLNGTVTQDHTTLPAATSTEQGYVESLFTIITNLLDDRYSALVTLEEEIREGVIANGIPITFHQLSLITSSSHTFEWIGAGTDINIALPYLGGTPDEQKEIIQVNGGRVYFTATDQRGDFKIGTQLKINRAKGVIEGRVFRKSLYSTLTPYILAIGEG